MSSTFSERLKELRNDKNMSMVQLAQAIGVTHAAISRWESGLQDPALSYTIQLAKFFDVTLDYLAGLTEY
ncbi:MAG: helix-turn-helix domain-containing protein [Firmicutes bacterium]|nr:helix-turn-helix domain-containing protein [Bacillota bacterium]